MNPNEIGDRIGHVEDLDDIVGAMRSISASRVKQARDRIDGVRRHLDTIEESISTALALLSDEERSGLSLAGRQAPGHLIVFCSEHAFAGKFDNVMLDRAEALAAERDARVGVVGTRGRFMARARNLEVEWTVPMATGADAVPEVARRIEREAFGRLEPAAVSRIDVVFAQRGNGLFHPEHQSLFPFDLDPFLADVPETEPWHYLPADRLLDRLVSEYVLADLIRVTMESFLAENISRLQSMQAAQENIEETLSDLQKEYRQAQQRQVTGELLDLVTGVQALEE